MDIDFRALVSYWIKEKESTSKHVLLALLTLVCVCVCVWFTVIFGRRVFLWIPNERQKIILCSRKTLKELSIKNKILMRVSWYKNLDLDSNYYNFENKMGFENKGSNLHFFLPKSLSTGSIYQESQKMVKKKTNYFSITRTWTPPIVPVIGPYLRK